MALFFGEESQAPLVDSSTSQAVKRRMNEFVGLLLFGLAGALAVALATYDVTDPSHFSATARTPSNWLGHPGAIVADAMMQVIGLSAWAVVLGLVAWGARFFFHIAPHRWLLRLPAVPIALILAMVFASLHPPYPGWPLSTGLGGLLGDSGVTAFLTLMPMLPGMGGDEDVIVQALTLSVACALLLAMILALGLTPRELVQIARWMGRSWMKILGGLFGAVGGAAKSAAKGAAHAATQARTRSEPVAETRVARRAPAKPVEEPEQESTARGFALPRFGMPKIGMPKLPSLRRSAVEEEDDPLDPSRPARREPLVSGDGDADERRALADSIRRLKGAEAEHPEDATPADRIRGTDDEDDAPGGIFGRRSTSVETTQKTARKSRRARAEAQPDLFDGSAAAYEAPPLALLEQASGDVREHHSESALEENARMLETVLEDYGVRGEIVAVKAGPVVTLYELEPAPGLKASRVIGLADDIARSMSALSARVSTVPGRSVIGIELPNTTREKVLLRELLEAAAYGDGREKLALALGKDISGGPVVADLAKMPHLLIAGTTGSGKSVAINTMILSILYRMSPQECRLIMIDPKMLELSVYDNIPHLMAPVVTDPKKALVALKWVVAEMEERYRKMSKMGVRNIEGYNARVRDAIAKGEEFSRTIQTGFDESTGEPIYETETFEPEEMPFIVVIVDEMADLMMVAGKEIEACIQRLAQMARASGIHLIMATQRPSVDVITGTIKANFPTRVSFQVTSKIDSRTILGEQGAEQLLGQGDMLYMAGGGRITRVHGPFVSDEEVEEVVSHLKSLGAPSYVDAVTEGGDDETERMVDQKLGLAPAGEGEDALYDQAVAIVARDRKCSTSYIQRKLAIGYNKAARLVEQMEDQGVVSPANAVGKREILIEER